MCMCAHTASAHTHAHTHSWARTERDSDTLNNPEFRGLGRIWQEVLSSTWGLEATWIQGYYQSFHSISRENCNITTSTDLLSIQFYIRAGPSSWFSLCHCAPSHIRMCVFLHILWVVCNASPQSNLHTIAAVKGRLLKHSGWCNLARRPLTWHQWTDVATATAVSRAQSGPDTLTECSKTTAKTRVEQEGTKETTEDRGEVSKVLEVALSRDERVSIENLSRTWRKPPKIWLYAQRKTC